MKKLVKDCVPPIITKILRKYIPSKYGFSGNYIDYYETLKKCTGYEKNEILSRTSLTTSIFKQDLQDRLVVHPKEQQLLYGLLYALGSLNQPKQLSVFDFGGALGNHYFTARRFIPNNTELLWSVCETAVTAMEGNKRYATEELEFISNPEQIGDKKIDVIIASGTMQYVDNPFEYLHKLIDLKAGFIIFNRLPLIDSNMDRLTIQKVSPTIYNASYPAWFFSRRKWNQIIEEEYEVISRWDVSEDTHLLDGKNVVCQGMLLKKRR